jgi:rod shape-determining protein MreC
MVFYHRNLVQNEKLKKEVELLKYNKNETREVFFENNRLRQLLSFKQRFSYKVIAARVVGHSADNWSSVIIVDRGESNGIRRGSVVVSYIGLVGRVVETTSSISKIMLINNPNFGVSGIVQRSRQEGLVTGTLSNSLIMKYLPADSDVAVSDVVVTSGLTETYPKGLIIGTVVDVGEEFSGLSHYAVIKSAVDLSSLEEVLIIVP